MANATPPSSVLAINGGSSSVKFAVHESTSPYSRHLHGRVRTGPGSATLFWHGHGGESGETPVDAPTSSALADHLLAWLDGRPEVVGVGAIGHRVVHGLTRHAPARITPDVVDELRLASAYAPDHSPQEIALIEACLARHPRLPQVACFDTAFHRTMPRVARLLPLPRRYQAAGLQRYGFHGLSYAYLLEQLTHVAGPVAGRGRVIFAHLGHGASLAAVLDGASIDTSMGFTPTGGLVMGTRTGDLDPGVASFLARTEAMAGERFDELVTRESGLLGVSETSSDMQDLLAREAVDVRAAEAVALFCYQAKKSVGAFTAALGGLDTLVFSAGIGERSAVVRMRICQGLGFLGIDLVDARNAAHAAVISAPTSRVVVRVIPTNEELMIVRLVAACVPLRGGPSWH